MEIIRTLHLPKKGGKEVGLENETVKEKKKIRRKAKLSPNTHGESILGLRKSFKSLSGAEKGL